MTKPHKFDPRAALGAFFAAFVVLGCWQITPGNGGGGAGGSAGTGGTAGVLEGTDIQVCAGACQKLIDCGAELDVDACKTDCASTQNANLVTCFRSVNATCDALASCTLDAVCLGNGAPQGNGSCSTAGTCLVACGGNPTATCPCDCALTASSGVASPYYNLLVCSLIHCSIECGTSGDPTSCDSCLGTSCKTEANNCP